jgi:hypothetical protein
VECSFPDWERGTLSVEGTIKRSLRNKIELSGSVSNVKDNLLLDPDINPENYLSKVTSRTLAYFDLALQAWNEYGHSILM